MCAFIFESKCVCLVCRPCFCLIQELDSEEDSGSNTSIDLSCETPPTDAPLLPLPSAQWPVWEHICTQTNASTHMHM